MPSTTVRHSATAALVMAAGEPFQLVDVDIDGPRDDEVLVRIDAVGICHADVIASRGQTPFPLPGVLGHEGTGIVGQVGASVDRVNIGDRVILTFDSCGRCAPSLSGRPTRCDSYLARNRHTRAHRP